MSELTMRQEEVLDFMRKFIGAHGVPPTFREIGAALDIRSPNGVRAHLNALVRKRAVRQSRDTGASRGYVPVVAAGCCPACGRPAGGAS